MKQTEVGLIPDDWEVKNIIDVLIPSKDNLKIGPFGSQLKKDYLLDNGIYKVFGQDNIYTSDFKYCYRFLTKEHFQKLQSCELKAGDFVISTMGTIGKCDIVPENAGVGIMDSHLVRLRLSSYIDKVFFKHFFQSEIIQKQISALSVGGIMDGLSATIIRKLNVIFLPKQEQQRIAKALSDVDAVISTTEKLIQKKKNIKQGTMQELLTGKKRLPNFATTTATKQTELGEIPADWEVKTLGELCSLITKQTGFDYSATIKPSLVLEHKNNTLPFIQNKDFEEEKINFNTDFYIPVEIAKRFPKIYLNEDVLLISISGRIGNVAYFKHTQDAFIGGAVGIAHFYNKHIINYCMRYLLSPNGQKQIFANEKSGAQHNLTIADVRKLSIPMPTNNKEQTAIANVLSSMDKEIETLNTKLEKYRNLKTAMMQQLLTGKIRLK